MPTLDLVVGPVVVVLRPLVHVPQLWEEMKGFYARRSA